MNYFVKTTLIGLFLMMIPSSYLFAASIVITSPEKVIANGQPVIVHVYLDVEQDAVSGISGNFSFPTDLFTVGDIVTKNSIVSLWVTQPSISKDKSFNQRTYLNFEGIFPGGHRGVYSPYHQGVKPGILFSVTLYPKKSGQGSLLVDDLKIHSFTADAKLIPSSQVVKFIAVQTFGALGVPSHNSFENSRSSLSVTVRREPLIHDNAWYLTVEDKESVSAIQEIFITESKESSPYTVEEVKWHEIQTPHILTHQLRNKYIHVKVVYANKTFSYTSIPPVENSANFEVISRILVLIGFVSFLLYKYGSHFYSSRKKFL